MEDNNWWEQERIATAKYQIEDEMKDVNNTEPKKMIDQLPIKTITAQQIREKVFSEGGLPDATEFYKASEIEQLLQRLGQPHVLTKVIKSITFGGKLTLEDLLT